MRTDCGEMTTMTITALLAPPIEGLCILQSLVYFCTDICHLYVLVILGSVYSCFFKKIFKMPSYICSSAVSLFIPSPLLSVHIREMSFFCFFYIHAIFLLEILLHLINFIYRQGLTLVVFCFSAVLNIIFSVFLSPLSLHDVLLP